MLSPLSDVRFIQTPLTMGQETHKTLLVMRYAHIIWLGSYQSLSRRARPFPVPGTNSHRSGPNRYAILILILYPHLNYTRPKRQHLSSDNKETHPRSTTSHPHSSSRLKAPRNATRTASSTKSSSSSSPSPLSLALLLAPLIASLTASTTTSPPSSSSSPPPTPSPG